MKNSVDRVYDRAVEVHEAFIVKVWQAGRDSTLLIDKLGTQFDQDMNRMQQAGFNELVKLGIIVAYSGQEKQRQI